MQSKAASRIALLRASLAWTACCGAAALDELRDLQRRGCPSSPAGSRRARAARRSRSAMTPMPGQRERERRGRPRRRPGAGLHTSATSSAPAAASAGQLCAQCSSRRLRQPERARAARATSPIAASSAGYASASLSARGEHAHGSVLRAEQIGRVWVRVRAHSAQASHGRSATRPHRGSRVSGHGSQDSRGRGQTRPRRA